MINELLLSVVIMLGGAAPPACALPDDFSASPFGVPCWRIDSGSGWSWTGSAMTWTHNYAAESMTYLGSTLGSDDQSAQESWLPASANASCGGVVLRAGASASDPHYLVCMRANGTRARAFYINAAGTSTQLGYNEACGAWGVPPYTFKASVAGGNDATMFTIYQNGVSQCTISAAGCTAAGTCVNVGRSVGIGFEGNDGVDNWTVDNFTAGTP